MSLTCRATRRAGILLAQRFRFADGYFIPIETSEALLESEIAVKPRVLSPVSRRTPQGPSSRAEVKPGG